MGDIIKTFTECLSIMSNSRAGWDFQLSPAQRAKENREEKEALAKARKIWAANPALHDLLRKAFADASPLATMREIEAA